VISKAAALGYFLIRNHPFVDGNKRIGHAMMEWLLRANQLEMVKEIDDQERTILAIAAGELNLDELTHWLRERVREA
jgi:death-on-curing protein